MNDKKPLLMKTAEVVDAWRVVPRMVLVAYGALTLHVVNWFMTIPEPTTSQMVLVTTISGLSAAVIGLYNNSSKNWVEYNREFTDRLIKLENPKEFIALTQARNQQEEERYTSYSRPSYSRNNYGYPREYDNQSPPQFDEPPTSAYDNDISQR